MHTTHSHSADVPWMLFLEEHGSTALQDVVNLEFETMLMVLLEEGRIHLDTEMEMRMQEPVVECICYRLQQELYHAWKRGAVCDAPARARAQMQELLLGLFSIRPTIRRPPVPVWRRFLRRFLGSKSQR